MSAADGMRTDQLRSLVEAEQAKRPRCETHGRSSMSYPPDGTCEDCRLVYLAGLPRAAA